MSRERRPSHLSRRQRVIGSLKKGTALFLAYSCLSRTLRSQFHLMKGCPSTVILLAPDLKTLGVHRKAAELLLNGRDLKGRTYIENSTVVHGIESQKNRDSGWLTEELASCKTVLLLARSLDVVPAELAATADATLTLERPDARLIHAARALLKRTPIDHQAAVALAGCDFHVLARALMKYRLDIDAVVALRMRSAGVPVAGPSLDDLPGYASLKPWARSLIEDLARERSGEIGWQDVDRGVLIHGPPGTGKTFFASALARSCGLPLVTASVSKWQSAGHLGNLLAAMNATFEKARSQQPAILFLDELDSIGDRTRFKGEHEVYSTQVVNHLLECIDGSEGRDKIIVVAATNFPEAIDPALLRSGRIERHVRLDLPDADERADMLRFHMGYACVSDDLCSLAADLDGWTPADLERLARDAKRCARGRQRAPQIQDIADALPPLQTLSDQTVSRTSLHEAGHAVVALVLWPDMKVALSVRKSYRPSASLTELGQAQFFHRHADVHTRESLEDLICRALAGAAAEHLVLGAHSDGVGGRAGSDIEYATRLATQIVASYGMGESLMFALDDAKIEASTAWRLPSHMRSEIIGILQSQFERAKALLSDHVSILNSVTDHLLENEKLSAEEVATICHGCTRTSER
ncbi:AAA family ATPase [Rhizobium beringeri]|uniref:AAA family ATPase n=1 Tax=Rhizobium beringeri TaxID=3019934 RepID=UPI002E0E8888|nr:AAA family ATPase [Rhizobium beringeri]